MSHYKKKAYSLAEALVTMFIIMLVAIIIVPSVVGKRSKKVTRVVGPEDHGIVECKAGETCEIVPSGDGTIDIVIVATGGGGGGAGSKCGMDITHIEGSMDKDVEGHCPFQNNQVLYVEASAAGGASISGMCDEYPGQFYPEKHRKNCNIFPNAVRTTTKEWCGTCTETTDKCVAYKQKCTEYKTDEDGKETDECETWEDTDTCETYEEISYDCVKSSSSSENGSCDYNKGTPAFCERLPADGPGGTCNGESYTSEKTTVNKGLSQEVKNTGRADVCSVTWQQTTQSGSLSGTRACNAAIFGGRGGSGMYFNKKICPKASPSICEEWRAEHTMGSYCSDEQKQKYISENLSGKCPLGTDYSLSNMKTSVDSMSSGNFWEALIKAITGVAYSMYAAQSECSTEGILEGLKEGGVCGHDPGEHNCNVDHSGEMERTCNHFKAQDMKSKMKIGRPGHVQGETAKDTYLFVADSGAYSGPGQTWTKPGIENASAQTLKGGVGGAVGVHGAEQGGRLGGKHSPGNEWTTIPSPNNVNGRVGDGKVGFVECRSYWVDRGYGGSAGEIRTGYLKDISGKVTISIGSGGAGGQASAGSEGGDVAIYVDGKEFATAKGGSGGTQTRIYEECTAGGEAIVGDGYNTEEYTGKKGEVSDTGYGTGGDGTSSVPGPNCRDTNGNSGIDAGVVIFY